MTLANEWTLLRERVDRSAFSHGRLGPYRVGDVLRRTRSGQVVIALHDTDPRVAELELLDPIQLSRVEHAILDDVNQAIGLEHRHVIEVLGGGISDGMVYVARTHRLGRTLAEVMSTAEGPDFDVGPGIAYSVIEAVRFLAEQGPARGACSLGGFDGRDVLLGYDGGIHLLSLGLRGLRDKDDSASADLRSCFELLDRLETWIGEPIVDVADRAEPEELLRRLRRGAGDMIADRRNRIGALLREVYADHIRSERAFFGLPTLH